MDLATTECNSYMFTAVTILPLYLKFPNRLFISYEVNKYNVLGIIYNVPTTYLFTSPASSSTTHI